MTLNDKLLAATNGTQLGAILRCAMDRNEDQCPRYTGKASVTSDGYLMANFVDTRGEPHWGAFVGGISDLHRNVQGLADHLDLSEDDRHATAQLLLKDWIGQDYRS